MNGSLSGISHCEQRFDHWKKDTVCASVGFDREPRFGGDTVGDGLDCVGGKG